jgi:hypothetical protein
VPLEEQAADAGRCFPFLDLGGMYANRGAEEMNVSVQTIDKWNVRTKQPSLLIGNIATWWGLARVRFHCMEVRRRRKRGGGGGGGLGIRQGQQVDEPFSRVFCF